MRRQSLFVSVLVLVCAAVATPARADDVEKQVIKMNKRAMDDYDSLEFESSRRTLVDALEKLRSNGLDDGPTAAKTYLNLGIVYINGFKDRNRGQQQFLNALKINAQIKVDPAVATPETDEAYAAAKRQLAASAPVEPKTPEEPTVPSTPTPTTPTPAPGDEVHGLVHNGVDESRPNAPVPIRAKLGSDVGATRVFLFYRGSGQEDFVLGAAEEHERRRLGLGHSRPTPSSASRCSITWRRATRVAAPSSAPARR